MRSASSSSLRPRISLQDPVDPSEQLRGTPILVANFSGGAEFLASYRHVAPAGEVAVLTRARPPNGAELVLEVTWPGLPNRVFVRATAWRRHLGLVAQLHADEQHARDFLLRMAAGYAVPYHPRRHKRYCVRLPLKWRVYGNPDMTDGLCEDVSAGGLLISTADAAPPMGEHVAVRLPAPAGQDLIITGEVRHTRVRTADVVFGLQFEHRESGEQKRLRQLLRGFAARGVVLLAT
jgi:hypothetical protein